MAKFYGKIGYIETTETKPDVWEEVVTERPYYGDLTRNSKRFEGNSKVNDDLTINNEISIVADPYAFKHFYAIRYVELNGINWKVNTVDVQFPRLVLAVGGVYNGRQTTSE